MSRVQIKVTNSLGTFEGFIALAANSTLEDASDTMKALIGGINTIQFLSIEDGNGTATVFPENVLRESVISAKAVE